MYFFFLVIKYTRLYFIKTPAFKFNKFYINLNSTFIFNIYINI
jgi:hypothetical protein